MAGFTTISISSPNSSLKFESYGYLYDGFIREEYRTSKLSFCLFNECEKWAKEKNCKYITAYAYAFNKKVQVCFRAKKMEKCKDLFNKLIKKLNNCNSFEKYYNLLKKDNYEHLFCESYLSIKKETYTHKHFFEKVNSLTIFFRKELSDIPKKSWIGIKLPNHPYI